MGWKVRGSEHGGGGEVSRTCPDRPWGPPRLLRNRYRVIPEGKGAGTLTTHPYLGQGKSRAIPLLLLCAFMACSRVKFTFAFTFIFTTTRRLHEKTRANLICLL